MTRLVKANKTLIKHYYTNKDTYTNIVDMLILFDMVYVTCDNMRSRKHKL